MRSWQEMRQLGFAQAYQHGPGKRQESGQEEKEQLGKE